jgi:hypothetical protein
MSRWDVRVITDEQIQRQRERYVMAKTKARKKRLPKFPSADRDSRLSAIKERLSSLYDLAVEMRDRDAAMAAQPARRTRR